MVVLIFASYIHWFSFKPILLIYFIFSINFFCHFNFFLSDMLGISYLVYVIYLKDIFVLLIFILFDIWNVFLYWFYLIFLCILYKHHTLWYVAFYEISLFCFHWKKWIKKNIFLFIRFLLHPVYVIFYLLVNIYFLLSSFHILFDISIISIYLKMLFFYFHISFSDWLCVCLFFFTCDIWVFFLFVFL